MRIVVARNAGFCMGVKRALEMVLDRATVEKGEIVTYGPLIHNPQVVDLLSLKKIRSSRDYSEFHPGRVAFISAHGISPETRKRLLETGATICDASCPDVLMVQGTIKRCAQRGYSTVIFGDQGHSEVVGLLGFTGGKGFVVGSAAEAENLPPLDQVCLVSQTTQNQEEYDEVARAVRNKAREVTVCQTICPSTRGRQDEMNDLLGKVDCLIVVGGRNSANTARLARIAAQRGLPVLRVETADELDLNRLNLSQTVGVTAGASTPNWLIQGVVDRLRDYAWSRKPALLRWGYRLVSLVVKSNLFIAFGAAALTLAAMILMGVPFRWLPPMLSFGFVLSIYNFNIFADQSALLLNQPSRYRFFRHNRAWLLTLSAFSLLGSVVCAALLGPTPLCLALFTLLLGFAYSFKLLPASFPRRRLKDIPGSKVLFSSLGWGMLTVLIPYFSSPVSGSYPLAPLVAFAFVFIVMFVRSTLLDIRDMQGDRLVGRETIPVIIGKDKTKLLLGIVTSFLAGLLMLADYLGWVPMSGYYLLAVVAYAYLYLYLYHRRVLFQDLFHEMAVDAQLILAGIIALIA